MAVWKDDFPFQLGDFTFHVSFLGCILYSYFFGRDGLKTI